MYVERDWQWSLMGTPLQPSRQQQHHLALLPPLEEGGVPGMEFHTVGWISLTTQRTP